MRDGSRIQLSAFTQPPDLIFKFIHIHTSSMVLSCSQLLSGVLFCAASAFPFILQFIKFPQIPQRLRIISIQIGSPWAILLMGIGKDPQIPRSFGRFPCEEILPWLFLGGRLEETIGRGKE